MSNERLNFLTTIKQLMRLTRNNSIQWKEKEPAQKNEQPTYEGRYNDIIFRLEPASTLSPVESYTEGHPPEGTLFDVMYRLFIMDRSDKAEIMSPPMKAVTDLVYAIRSPSNQKKLRDINRQLESAP